MLNTLELTKDTPDIQDDIHLVEVIDASRPEIPFEAIKRFYEHHKKLVIAGGALGALAVGFTTGGIKAAKA